MPTDSAPTGNDALARFLAATREFARLFSRGNHDVLRGVTDGKAIGTYIERHFQQHLIEWGIIQTLGNAAKGIDLPALDTDIKATSSRQPQSSSPFTSFKQKIEGLGYNLILFVYDKRDTATGCSLSFTAVRYIAKERTADYQTTRGIREIIANNGNAEDFFAFLVERMIPVDEVTLLEYARRLLAQPPAQGYLTISNALQWRLQYQRHHRPLSGRRGWRAWRLVQG